MKKIVLIVALVIILAAGGWYMLSQKKNATTQTTTTNQTQEQTVQQPSQPAEPVEKSLKVDYVGSFPDGQVFDTNIADVAKKNNIFAEGREYAPLEFTVGTRAVIPGFEKAAAGLAKTGDSVKVTLKPEDAYGDYDDKKIIDIQRSIFQEGGIVPAVGQTYQMGGQIIKVVEVKETTVKIDTNHPMAGKTLIFEITLR